MTAISCVRATVSSLLFLATATLIGISTLKYLARRRATFSHEQSLGSRVMFPHVGACFPVIATDRNGTGEFVRDNGMVEGLPVMRAASHDVYMDG